MKNFIILSLLMVLSLHGVKAKLKFENQKSSITSIVDPPPLIEGFFYRTLIDNKIYWYVNGSMHHIQHIETYNYLFENPDNYLFNINTFNDIPVSTPQIGVRIGQPVAATTFLGQYNNIVYLRYGDDVFSLHYQIPNPATFNQYHLKWSSIINFNYSGILGGIRPFPSRVD